MKRLLNQLGVLAILFVVGMTYCSCGGDDDDSAVTSKTTKSANSFDLTKCYGGWKCISSTLTDYQGMFISIKSNGNFISDKLGSGTWMFSGNTIVAETSKSTVMNAQTTFDGDNMVWSGRIMTQWGYMADFSMTLERAFDQTQCYGTWSCTSATPSSYSNMTITINSDGTFSSDLLGNGSWSCTDNTFTAKQNGITVMTATITFNGDDMVWNGQIMNNSGSMVSCTFTFKKKTSDSSDSTFDKSKCFKTWKCIAATPSSYVGWMIMINSDGTYSSDLGGGTWTITNDQVVATNHSGVEVIKATISFSGDNMVWKGTMMNESGNWIDIDFTFSAK